MPLVEADMGEQILRWTCHLCPGEIVGTLHDMMEHLETVHDEHPQRWPDGALVVDMSDVPELLTGGQPGTGVADGCP